MPEEAENKTERRRRDGSAVSIVLWWQKFHFSGRVIMCSVLFGLGLVLIGGIIFAINNDDNPSKDNLPDEMPSKPPSNVVGPVIMGIGGFIVTVGIIMCLFETQVCRKKNADSRPLIEENQSDVESKNTKPKEVSSKTQKRGHHGHKHDARKDPSSPKRSKHAKSHHKEKKEKTPPVSIGISKSFMTSSEDKFLTPPSTLENTSPVHKNSNEIENQASTSLLKSFTSSGPSWTQSTEFQTPATSFNDSSISLENSTEISEKKAEDGKRGIPTELMINSGFMTPITLEEEKVQKMATQIQNQKKAERNSSSELKTNAHFTKINDEPNVNSPPESGISTENKDLKLLKTRKADGYDERNLSNEDRSKEAKDQTLAASDLKNVEETGKVQGTDTINKQDLLQVTDRKNTSDKIQEATVDNEMPNQIGITIDEESSIIPKEDQKEELKVEEEASQDVSSLNEKEQHNLLQDNKKDAVLKDANQDDNHIGIKGDEESSIIPQNDQEMELKPAIDVSQDVSSLVEKEQPNLLQEDKKDILKDVNQDDTHLDLESSVSSDETVVSQSSVLEKPVNVEKSESAELGEKVDLTTKDVKLDTAESNGNTQPENDLETQSNHSNMQDENKFETNDSKPTQNGSKVDEISTNMSATNTEERIISSKTDFVANHSIQPDTPSENESGISNLKHLGEDGAKDAIIDEHEKSNSS